MKSVWRLHRAVPACNCSRSLFRSFSNSAIHQAYLPEFPSTQSPEFDQVLQTIQQRILVPAHLNRAQRRLVNAPSKVEYLTKEEVIIKVGDVDVRLQHEDLSKNRVKHTKAFREALKLTKDSSEWDVWFDLLKGYHSANIQLSEILRVKFVRKALEAGRLDLVLRILNRADVTGISLATPEIRDLVFLAFREKAREKEWDMEVMQQSLRQAEKLLMIMETPAHVNEEQKAPLLPAAVPLELSYRLYLASKKLEQQDEETEAENAKEFVPLGYLEKAQIYANRILSFPDFLSLADESNQDLDLEKISHLTGPLESHGFIAVGCGLQAAKLVLDKKSDKTAVQSALSNLELAFEIFKEHDVQKIYAAQQLDASA